MILILKTDIIDPVMQYTTLLSSSESLKRFMFHFSQRSTRFYRLSHSEIFDIEKVAVHSSLRLPNNKCALIESRANESNQSSHMAEQDIPPPTITAMKIPIIKKGEYDIWSMRMRQYICHTDHNLWDVIVNGDLEEEPAPTRETSAPPAPKTAKQLAAKKN
ncbi:hypothetical protein Tco_0967554 [Tanacetum coccineum]